MMKYRNTIIVLVVLAALIAYISYDQQQQAIQGTPTAVPSVPLLALNPDDVVSIQVSTVLSRTVAHKDSNNVWQMDEPTKEEADTARLNNLVPQWAKLSATRALTNTPTDLAPFGLVTGTITLQLTMKDNHSEVVRIGIATLDGATYYAQHVGDPKVYLINSSTDSDLQGLLDMPPKKPTPTPTSPPIPTPAPVTPAPPGTPAASGTAPAAATPAAAGTPAATSAP